MPSRFVRRKQRDAYTQTELDQLLPIHRKISIWVDVANGPLSGSVEWREAGEIVEMLVITAEPFEGATETLLRLLEATRLPEGSTPER